MIPLIKMIVIHLSKNWLFLILIAVDICDFQVGVIVLMQITG